MPSKKFRLKEIQISGFRGYREQKSVNFNAPVVLLFGGNGSGKSSTLGAIEWCLFGDFASVTADRRGPRDELVHDLSGRADVTLRLRGPKKLTINRLKKRRTKRTSLFLSPNRGSEIPQEYSEGELFSILNLGFDDFVRAVYLHQENVRGMLTDDLSSRNETMDRLFGLERFRNISDGLSLKKVKDAIKDLSIKREGAVGELKSRLEEASRAYTEAKTKAARVGVPENSLAFSSARSVLDKTNEAITQTAEVVGTEISTIPSPTSVENLENATEVLRSLVRKIRGQLPGQVEISDLAKTLSRLNSLESNLTESMTRYSSVQRELETFEEEHGNAEKLEKDLKGVSRKIERLEHERQEASSKERVILDGLEYLQEFTTTICPICGKKIDPEHTCRDLREEVKEVVGEKLKKADKKIAETKELKSSLEGFLENLAEVTSRLEDAHTRVNSLVEELAKELGQPISSADKGMKLLRKRCSDAEFRRRKIEKPLKKREEELQEIEGWLNQMEAIIDALRWDERRSKLSRLQKAKAFKNVDETLRQLGELEQTVRMVAESVQHVQGELARSLVKDAMPRIKEFYGELLGHPYYQDLQIDVESETVRGRIRNSYRIIGVNPNDGAETLASDRYSTGQMNCVALSIFLAMAHKDAFFHNLGFLILDDPSQNLDTNHKKALCRILAKTAKKRQLVISTQDNEFQEMLKSTFRSDKVIAYEFGSWAIDGPTIKEI